MENKKYICSDCGGWMDEEESKVFTCCETCWDKHYGKQESIPMDAVVKVQITEMLEELFNKYKLEKNTVLYMGDEFYLNGLADGKMLALVEIKENLSNLSA